MNTPLRDRELIIQHIERMIDKASFRQCYERCDPRIEQFIVVASDCSLAEVASQLVEGSSGVNRLKELIDARQVVAVVPDVRSLLDALAIPAEFTAEAQKLKAYLEKCIDNEVEAFYSPPFYYIRFTGRRWE